MRTVRILFSFLLISLAIASVGAVNFPANPPNGSQSGGIFSWYFQNIVNGSGGLNFGSGQTTNSGMCPGGQGVVGFYTSAAVFGLPICASTSLAPGLQGQTLVYSGGSWIATSDIFDLGGKIGIGTTTPGTKLDVNGDATINGVRVGQGGLSSYENMVVGSSFSNLDVSQAWYGRYNTALGLAAVMNNTSGSKNTGVGYVSLRNNTTGDGNAALGYYALYSNTTGGNNVAMGSQPLFSNTSGNYNVALGMNSLYNNTSGPDNVAIGEWSLYSNQNAGNSIAIGNSALYNNLAAGNIGLGRNALRNNTSGSSNIGIGLNALQYNQGSNNIALGFENDSITLSGSNNTFLGNLATYSSGTISNATAIGAGAQVGASYSTAIGAGVTTTNSNTVVIGGSSDSVGIGTSSPGAKLEVAGQIKITGGGPASGEVLTTDGSGLATWQPTGYPCVSTGTGASNYCYGLSALQSNTSGGWNTANGWRALMANTSGGWNTAFGSQTLQANTTGNYNSAVGVQALGGNATGNYNIGFGYNAGSTLTSGDNNIFIGKSTQPNVGTTSSNQMNIGNILYGNGLTGAGAGNLGIGIINPTHKLDISYGVAKIQSDGSGNPGLFTTQSSWTASNISIGILHGNGTNGLNWQTPGIWSGLNGFAIGHFNSGSTYDDACCDKASVDGKVDSNFDFTWSHNMRVGPAPWNAPAISNAFEVFGNSVMNNALQVDGFTTLNGPLIYRDVQNNATSYLWGQYGWGNQFQFSRRNIDSSFKALDGYIEAGSGNLIWLNSVGIGASTPGAKLEVAGQVKITGGSPAAGKVLTSNATGLASWQPIPYPCTSTGTGTFNYCYGTLSLQSNSVGSYNTAQGYQALRSNTSGSYNVANGYQSLYSNTSGGSNVANGEGSLYSNTTGNYNIAVGDTALYSNSTGLNNVASGFKSLYNNISGGNNSAYGHNALVGSFGANTANNNNTAIGSSALSLMTTGSGNTAVGSVAGYNLGTNLSGCGNTFIGYNTAYATNADNPLNNATAIGANTIVQKSNTVILGNNANVGIGTIAPTAKLEVVGGDASINSLTIGRGNGSLINNTALGAAALASISTGFNNVGVGYQSLWSNSTGNSNTANGYLSLMSNTIGSYNTAQGSQSLFSNINGQYNTAQGYQSLATNVAGNYNTAQGYLALSSNTGSYNTAQGYIALRNNTSGTNNVAIGSSTLYNNTTGNYNVALGDNALSSNITGGYNVALGPLTLSSNTGGSYNVANGYFSMYQNTTGTNNTANGNNSLQNNTTGTNNTANGNNALAQNKTGSYNSAYGDSALGNSVTNSNNTAIGRNAGYNSSLVLTGSNNTFVGYNATYTGLVSNSTAVGANVVLAQNNTVILGAAGTSVGIGTSTPTATLEVSGGDAKINGLTVGLGGGSQSNTVVSFSALANNTTGTFNTVVGFNALANNTTGSVNTALGTNTLMSSTTGLGNTAVGSANLMYITTGNYNTALGNGVLVSLTGSASNNIGIGYGAEVPSATGSNQIRLGNTAITYAGIQVAWTVTSDRRYKDEIRDIPYGLDLINMLRPVDYVRKNDEHQKKEAGFIAQEVESTLEKIGYKNTGLISKDDKGYLSLRYNDFIPLLTKATQELSASLDAFKKEYLTQIELLKKENTELRNQNQDILRRLEILEKRLPASVQ